MQTSSYLHVLKFGHHRWMQWLVVGLNFCRGIMKSCLCWVFKQSVNQETGNPVLIWTVSIWWCSIMLLQWDLISKFASYVKLIKISYSLVHICYIGHKCYFIFLAVYTDLGQICVFPFTYKGNRYYGCTRADNPRIWCGLSGHVGSWGRCAGDFVPTGKIHRHR